MTTSWAHTCPPCRRHAHGQCEDTPANPCDCAYDGHGKRQIQRASKRKPKKGKK